MTSIYVRFSVLIFCLIHLNANSQTNIDFEQSLIGQYTASNSVSGWSLESGANSGTNGACPTNTAYVWNQPISEFWIRQTPILNHTKIGNILHSPLGGTKIAQLNDTLPGILMTRLSTTFSVTNANTLFEIAFCGSWDASGHLCCDQPFFLIKMFDCLGAPLSCSSLSLTPAGPACTTGVTSYSVNGSGVSWTNWVVKTIDLTPFIGTCITLQIVNGDCDGGAHHGSLYFDVRCRPQLVAPGLTGPGIAGPVSFCAGSNVAVISAPLGYATYSWIPPITSSPISASQATLSTLTINNPVPGNVYTVMLNSASGCQFVSTNTIVFSQVNIAGIGSTSTCIGGSGGSATVQGNGSGAGYTYTWINTVNSATIGTTAVINNLAPGNYSVIIAASGSQSVNCGYATATVNVPVGQPGVKTFVKPYCGSLAYFSIPGGINYQWFVNGNTVPAISGGTASTFTYISPMNNSTVTYTVIDKGCKDSVEYILTPVTPGQLQVSSATVCPGAAASAVISLTPANGSPSGNNSFSVFAGSNTPAYSATVNSTAFNSYTAINLFGGGSYSVFAFDGSCYYNSNFTVPTLISAFSFSLPNSPTICANQNYTATSIPSGSTNPTAFTYSWSPGNLITVGSASQTAVLSPTSLPGSVSTVVYTTIITPTQVNCPLNQTFTITVANLLSPTINPIPDLCDNGTSYTIVTSASGGKFHNPTTQLNSPVDTLTGVISPSVAQLGVSTFTYAVNVSTCVASATGSFFIQASPQLNLTADDTICAGENKLLQVSGADTYTWSNAANGSSITISPLMTMNYSVTGRDSITSCMNQKTVLISVEGCASVRNEILNNPYGIFPNPFDDFIVLETKSEVIVCIIDISGRSVRDAKKYPEGSSKINLSSLPAGIYFIKMTGQDQSQIYKIIKNP